jgi:hypothetical protein
MKKNIIFILIALAGFMFAGVQSANAQIDYDVNISWDDSNCSCSDPVTKYARVILTYESTSTVLDDSGWYRVYGDDDDFSSNAAIYLDAQHTYRLSVAIAYYSGGNVCCSGTRSELYDGDDFLIPIIFPEIEMN